MRREARPDGGSIHVLEAVIVASIMLTAVAFVATFENPATGSNSSRELLGRKASDAIQLLIDTPVTGSTFGDNLFSVLLAQCLQGNCTNLTAKMDKLLPQGASYALYVSNGHDTYPVYVTREPAGEAITARALLEPHWSYVFTSTGLSVVNNETDPQITYALPVYNSNVVSPGGSPIKIIVKGEKQSDGSAYTLEAFYATLALDPSRATHYPAASLNFLVTKTGTNAFDDIGARVPGAYWDRYDEVMNTTTGHPNNASVEFRLQLNESAGVPIPLGAELKVSVPRGWNASGWNDENWEVLQDATSRNATYNGSDVVARSLRAFKSESVELRFNATYHGDLLRYYPFRASLSRGASAEANLLVEADRWPENTQTFAIPRVVASVPRPMGSTAETTWSLAVNVPYHPAGGFQPSKKGLMTPDVPTGSPSTIVSGKGTTSQATDLRGPADAITQSNSNVIISEVIVLEQDGKEIFGGVTPGRVGEGHGAWTSEGDRLVWRGDHHTTTQGTLNLTFNVTGAGVAGGQATKSELLPPVAFNAFSGRLLAQTAPGLYRDAILPNNTTASYYGAYTGYLGYDPGTVGLTNPLFHGYSSSPLYRETYLRGTGNYTVHPVAPFSDALYGSYVAVEKRNVPIGGEVVLTADVQSVLYALSAAGQSAGVNLTFYPPWAGDSKTPIWTQANLDSGFVTSSVVQLVMLDITGDGYPDAIAGTDQGRVIAFDGISGQRVQGNTWIAPILDGSDAVSAIRQLKLITLGGVQYVVVGTDGKSGVYVLDKDLDTAWEWTKTTDTATQGIAALDTRADIDGDGRSDIVLAMDNGAVYVLQAPAGGSTLQMLAPAAAPPSPFGAFNKSQGTPATMLGLKKTGHSATPGVAVSLVSLPGAEVNYRLDTSHPEQTSANPQLVAKTPRAGLTVFDNVGATAWTLLNSPVTTMAAYDYNGDPVEDLLLGSNSGHVLLVNGQRGAAPLGSGIWIPVQELVDGDAHDLAHSVWLTDDGTIAFTYDGWGTHNCVSCDPIVNGFGLSYPTMNGIAMNSTMGIWAAGDNSWMLRSTEGLAPGYPWMSLVIPNATKAGETYDFHVSLHRFNDVHFGWGEHADHGFAVGSPLLLGLCVSGVIPISLLAYCNEGLLMETVNGGQDWDIKSAADLTMNATAGVGTKVTTNLTRVNFTTSQLGWVTGEHGTLLRSVNNGSTWAQIGLPTTVHIRDISCEQTPDAQVPTDPTTCIVVGDGGVALRTTNALANWPLWTNITAQVGAGARDLLSAGVVSKDEMYIGGENVILHTLDGGDSWTALPLGYVENDANRMSIFPDGTGYIWGGDEANARQWTIHDFVRSATARTTDVTSGTLNSSAKVHHVSAWAAMTTAVGSTATVYLSADGGNTWTAAVDTGNGQTSSVERTVPVALTTNKYSVDLAPGEPEACGGACGTDVRFRVDLGTTPDISFQSVFLADLKVEVQYRLGGADFNKTFNVDLSSTAMKNATTTASWNTDAKAIHLPVLDAKFWSQNVSGQVLDLQTGWNVAGDAHHEVWVATGGVVAENSPDYMIYAGTDPDRYMRPDNRIYLLDGENGNVLRRTASLGGNVTGIRLADENADGKPDWLFATVWTPKTEQGSMTAKGALLAFNATTLEPKASPYDEEGWTYELQPGAIPYDLELGYNQTNVTAYLARGVYASTSSEKEKLQGGAVEGFVGHERWHMWSSRADDRGQYHVAKDIPLNWFFGPYVVEVKVDWKDSVDVVENGKVVTKSIVQSAQFYDYFMVTPPDAVNPPSPIYTVHLMTWLDDWR